MRWYRTLRQSPSLKPVSSGTRLSLSSPMALESIESSPSESLALETTPPALVARELTLARSSHSLSDPPSPSEEVSMGIAVRWGESMSTCLICLSC